MVIFHFKVNFKHGRLNNIDAMPTILEEAEDDMDETIFKGGKNSCNPNQGGHYGSRGIVNLFLNDRMFVWHIT